jgi:hypothetical protein
MAVAAPLVALIALLALTACGGEAGASQVASADDSTTDRDATETPTEEEETDPDQAALEFAKCMRENGVDMPDPEPGEAGGGFRSFGGGADGADRETMEAALDACRDLAPQFEGPDPTDPEQQEQMLAMAECLREHGIDVPDPSTTGGGIQLNLGDQEDIDPDEMRAAAEECRESVGLPEPDGERVESQ